MDYNKVPLTKYFILEGEHLARGEDGKPVNFSTWYNHKKLKELEYVAEFRTGTIPNYEGDKDEEDYHKGGGFTLDMVTNNQDALMWAWTSRYQKGKILLSGYMNHGGGRELGSATPLEAKQFQRVYIRLTRASKNSQNWTVYMRNLTTGDEYSQLFKTRTNGFWLFGRWSRRIPTPWHGGANNSPGPYGGVSPTNMEIGIWYNSKNY